MERHGRRAVKFHVGNCDMIPDFATHYYLSGKRPFLSLSDLDGDAEHPIFREMLNKHKNDHGYRRRYGMDYLSKRRACEEKLRWLFESRGGRPRRTFPYYLVLGESDWFFSLNDGHVALRIPLVELPPQTTSITFPDSFLAMTAATKPYFEKVYLLTEIDEVLRNYEYRNISPPITYDQYWEGDFELYAEIQIWDDETIRRHW